MFGEGWKNLARIMAPMSFEKRADMIVGELFALMGEMYLEMAGFVARFSAFIQLGKGFFQGGSEFFLWVACEVFEQRSALEKFFERMGR